jgi:hypothetical protein
MVVNLEQFERTVAPGEDTEVRRLSLALCNCLALACYEASRIYT